MATDERPPSPARIPWGSILGQLCTALITFGAVYFAAKVGFEQTIRYTRYQEATDTLLILQVVRAELQENVAAVDEFGRYAEGMGESSRLLLDRVYQVKPQAFEGAGSNDMYFRLGPDIIVSLRRFYEEALGLRAYLTGTVVGTVGEGGTRIGFSREVVQEAWKNFKPLLVQARDHLLPLMERRILELENTRASNYGKGVEPIGSPPARPAPK